MTNTTNILWITFTTRGQRRPSLNEWLAQYQGLLRDNMYTHNWYRHHSFIHSYLNKANMTKVLWWPGVGRGSFRPKVSRHFFWWVWKNPSVIRILAIIIIFIIFTLFKNECVSECCICVCLRIVSEVMALSRSLNQEGLPCPRVVKRKGTYIWYRE